MPSSEYLERLVKQYGEAAIVAAFERSLEDSSRDEAVLTIVANRGMHHLPDELQRGHVYIASEGSIDISSPESIHRGLADIIRRAAVVLKSKKWTKVYLVPHGHSTISMLLKLLVFRITSHETIDWFYTASTGYVAIDVSIRPIVTEIQNQDTAVTS